MNGFIGGDILGTVIWFGMFFVFMFLYPRLMLSQLIYKLENTAKKMEEMSEKANKMVAKKISKKKDANEKIKEFTEFFVVQPSNIDPYGMVKKIDTTIKNMEDRFKGFALSLTSNKKESQQIDYALRAAVGLKQISKIVRHYVEIAKKYKNLQIAMILQMQMPMIEKIAEAELHGTNAFLKSMPVGDSIGPIVAVSYMTKSKKIAEDIFMSEVNIKGRKCFVIKADGPEPHLGRTDHAIEKIMKKNKISRIVTIDASQMFEGEKQGSVAEGVGFAMGGYGQREMIENNLLNKGFVIDGVIIKVGAENAIKPMNMKIFKSLDKARELVERSIERSKKNSKIIVVGVGNSTGIGNDKSVLKDVEKVVKKIDSMQKAAKKK